MYGRIVEIVLNISIYSFFRICLLNTYYLPDEMSYDEYMKKYKLNYLPSKAVVLNWRLFPCLGHIWQCLETC